MAGCAPAAPRMSNELTVTPHSRRHFGGALLVPAAAFRSLTSAPFGCGMQAKLHNHKHELGPSPGRVETREGVPFPSFPGGYAPVLFLFLLCR